MRAIQLSAFGLGHLELVELSAPRPASREVLVRLEADTGSVARPGIYPRKTVHAEACMEIAP